MLWGINTIGSSLIFPIFFPGFLKESVVEGENFEVLKDTVSTYGDLNDLLTRQHYLIEDLVAAPPGEAEEISAEICALKKEIVLAWKALRLWQEEKGVSIRLAILVNDLQGL